MKPCAYGMKSLYFCSQDSEHCRASKKVKDENKKNRDKLPMKTYACQSTLYLRIIHLNSTIRRAHIILQHNTTHPKYDDITIPPDVCEFIEKNLWTSPADIAKHIHSNEKWGYSGQQNCLNVLIFCLILSITSHWKQVVFI